MARRARDQRVPKSQRDPRHRSQKIQRNFPTRAKSRRRTAEENPETVRCTFRVNRSWDIFFCVVGEKPKHKKCDKSYDANAHEMSDKELNEALKSKGEGMKKVVTLDECRWG